MSWIIRNLVSDRTQIISNINQERTNVVGEKYENLDGDTMFAMVESISFETDLEDDSYTLLLQIESKIKEMFIAKQITDREVIVLKMTSEGYSYREIAEFLDIGWRFVRKIFHSTSNKIAFSLGGVFTDEGYAEYMTTKYRLNDSQISKMINLMESKRRL